jgi:2-keto-4-pentenoate hydratase/2-oxohepta-3-ene-1,7-dioic acid hydratase in catechol pathway
VAHALELNNEVPAEPVFFMKPDTSLLKNNKPFLLPGWSKEVHHEIELVIRICRTAKKVDPLTAASCFEEIGIGIDFTARDIQDQLKAKGLPWEKAKSFDHAAVLGTAWRSLSDFDKPASIGFRLDINGLTVQSGDSSLMIFNFESIIAHVSKYVTLKKGDLIYTGTPAGVGPVQRGDHLEGYLEGYLEGKKLLDFFVA